MFFMDSDSSTKIIFLIVCLILSAFFSAAESAYTAVNKIRLKNLASEGNKRAAVALNLSENYNSLLSTILVGNNIVNIAASSVATILFIKLLPEGLSVHSASISTAVITILVLIFGEISPKTIATDSPEKIAMLFARPLKFLTVILTPLNFLFELWKKMLVKIFPPNSDGITEEELLTIVEEAQSGGEFNDDEAELIRNAIEFNDIQADEIHTPRVNVVGIDVNSTREEADEVFSESGYSRLPVYKETIDNIIGIVNQKDFYNANNADKDIRHLMHAPIYAIPSTKISELLAILQKSKTHIAVLIDEYGGTVGIVTLEDILEELVGEIWDEHDEVIEEFSKTGENKYRILCTASLDDMFEKFDLENKFDIPTVSGWVIETIGRLPRIGDTFTYENLDVRVTKCDSRHVLEIEVTANPVEDNKKDED